MDKEKEIIKILNIFSKLYMIKTNSENYFMNNLDLKYFQILAIHIHLVFVCICVSMSWISWVFNVFSMFEHSLWLINLNIVWLSHPTHSILKYGFCIKNTMNCKAVCSLAFRTIVLKDKQSPVYPPINLKSTKNKTAGSKFDQQIISC